MLHDSHLLPGAGYRVRTLHGLANDIVRQKPELAGLDNYYQIADERIHYSLTQDAARKWMRLHADVLVNQTSDFHDLKNTNIQKAWLELVQGIATAFIRQAKDIGVEPAQIHQEMEKQGWHDELLQMGLEIYTDYQQGLAYRGAIDFDDLIRMALQVISSDTLYLEELQSRWPYILEDEAQDSSRKQEEILRLLSSHSGNWVRVGDPNQAIYETFTTASPEYLIRFMQADDVTACNLPESGRSTASIIHLANQLITWTKHNHPNQHLRTALREPLIVLTNADDPHPNPVDNPRGITLYMKQETADEEIERIAQSIKKWLPEHMDETVAALVPINQHGEKLVQELQRNNIPHVELLRTSDSTRKTVTIFTRILQHIANPATPSSLAEAYAVFARLRVQDDKLPPLESEIVRLLKGCKNPESYLWPKQGQSWLESDSLLQADVEIQARLEEFQQLMQRWHKASLLPIDQLILIISMDLFTDMAELALAYKIAQMLERAASDNPEWNLPDFIGQLLRITDNKQNFSGFSERDTGFDPNQYKGKVVVSTFHKAKGLEWDRVYLLSVNNFDFPSGSAGDSYVSEKYFVKDQVNLQAEVLARLNNLMGVQSADGQIDMSPTEKSRLDTAAERLRVLFVGITRARKELIITWNTGRRKDCQPAQALLALDELLKQEQK